MKTALCHLLGIEDPIIAAPMGPDLTGPELVAAVGNASGLGVLQAQLCACLMPCCKMRSCQGPDEPPSPTCGTTSSIAAIAVRSFVGG